MKNGFEQSYTNLVTELLTDCGYAVKHKIIHAPNYGVPQRRRRAFFVASRDNESFDFPAATHHGASGEASLFESSPYVTVWDAIGGLPSFEHGEGTEPTEYPVVPFHPFQQWARSGSGQISNHIARHLQPTQYDRLASLEPGQGIKDLPELLCPRTGYSGAYGRLTKEMVAPTITRWVFHLGPGRFGHSVNPRVITIREAARLQAFPDTCCRPASSLIDPSSKACLSGIFARIQVTGVVALVDLTCHPVKPRITTSAKSYVGKTSAPRM